MRRALLPLLLAALTWAAPAVAGDPQAGARLYQEGRWQGAGLAGRIADGPPLPSRRLACAGCHGRDRGGGGEGGVTAPPLTPWHLARRGLDAAALRAALTTGDLPDGARLNRAMPRFALDAAAVEDLLAYLRDPAPVDAPGVAPDAIGLGLLLPPGLAAAGPLLAAWAEARNRAGGFWGRRLVLVRLPAGSDRLDAALAATPVLFLLAPLADAAQAAVLRRHGVPELAPLAPPADQEPRIVTLGPALAGQAALLAQALRRRLPGLRDLPVLLPPDVAAAPILAALATVPGLVPHADTVLPPAGSAALLVLDGPSAAALPPGAAGVIAGPVDLLAPRATRPGMAGTFLLADPRAGLPAGGTVLQRHLAAAIRLAEAALDRAGRRLTRAAVLAALAEAPIELGGAAPFDYARFPDGGTAAIALLEAEPARRLLTVLPAPATP